MNSRMGRMGKRGNEQKPKDVKYSIKRLWQYLYKFKGWLLLAFLLTIFSNAFALVGPKLLGRAIDAMDLVDEFGKHYVDFDTIFLMAGLMASFYVLSGILNYILSRIMIKIGKKVVFKMREDAFAKIQILKVSYFDSNQVGDIISKMSYDIDTINTSLSSDVISIVTSFITIVVSLIMMITIKPILVLVFVFTIPLSLLFTRFMLKKTGVYFKQRSITLGQMNGYAEEMITGNKTIKAYVQEDRINDDFDNYNNNATKAAYRAEYLGSITGPGVNFINNLSLTLVCIFGTILVLNNMISLGDMGSFVLYSRKFSGPINEIANIFVDLESALAASERVFNLIDQEPEAIDKEDAIIIDAKGDIEFKNVSFSYDGSRTIIDNLSFSVKSGETIAIVGPTGAGKTTIVNLLMRFYDIDSGIIKVDDIDINDIKRDSLRNNYTMVLQDTWLFHGSVYENVSYGKKDATIEDVIRVCKAAKIHNFIMHLPEGYDTILIEGGTNISKGQKQLLTIARAMLLDKKMLILDEATSNVDTQTELKIQDAMKELMKGKTCFIIAHRLSTIQNADLILVMNNGKIVEKGKHNELLSQDGFYKELYYSQFN